MRQKKWKEGGKFSLSQFSFGIYYRNLYDGKDGEITELIKALTQAQVEAQEAKMYNSAMSD